MRKHIHFGRGRCVHKEHIHHALHTAVPTHSITHSHAHRHTEHSHEHHEHSHKEHSHKHGGAIKRMIPLKFRI